MFSFPRFFVIVLVGVGMILGLTPAFLSAQQLTPQERAKLETELADVEKQIKEQEAILTNQKNKSASIQRDIAILTAKISAAKLRIRAKNLEIDNLTKDIGNKNTVIGNLTSKMEREKESFAQLIRKTYEMNDYGLSEILLVNKSLASFLEDTDAFETIQIAIKESVDELNSTRIETTREKEDLQKKRDAETNARKNIEAEQRAIEKDEAEQKRLLNLSKTQEKTYEVILAERAARASQIKSALFELRDSGPIPFEVALQYANQASRATGVRAAFILAIIQQESNLGQNVGTCNRAGDPPSKHWSVIMPGPQDKATGRSGRDDQTVFLRLMKELGMNPEGRPLSCPWGNGWGGAMGPSQFIPTTWALFQSRVGAAVGKTPNPWDARDAFTASALYLKDLGAATGTFTSERNAACRYYSGRACDSRQPANAFYGDQVMKRAQNIQENMINVLQGI